MFVYVQVTSSPAARCDRCRPGRQVGRGTVVTREARDPPPGWECALGHAVRPWREPCLQVEAGSATVAMLNPAYGVAPVTV